eukprot:bmy_05355T0
MCPRRGGDTKGIGDPGEKPGLCVPDMRSRGTRPKLSRASLAGPAASPGSSQPCLQKGQEGQRARGGAESKGPGSEGRGRAAVLLQVGPAVGPCPGPAHTQEAWAWGTLPPDSSGPPLTVGSYSHPYPSNSSLAMTQPRTSTPVPDPSPRALSPL